MKCWKCEEDVSNGLLKNIRNVPNTGRASTNKLCCKHDRIMNGKQSANDLGEKQLEKLRKKMLALLITA